ncbi:MAG: AAA-like domain-containing protein [Deltaproteobacteria bacterium]|jgi:hypothetical protein|nr:AAA-like domain-containing protein [Deltaproteobacteria bacterium]
MTITPIKVFNTVGPCEPLKHYMVPVLPRQREVIDLIDGEYYFVLHAPRQSGKTTFLKAITNQINSEGIHYAFNCSLEALDNTSDVNQGIDEIISQIQVRLSFSDMEKITYLNSKYITPSQATASTKLLYFFRYLCNNLDKQLIIFFDEMDCLLEGPLISFLRQIRLGYNERNDTKKTKFPRTIALVGMRDIRDYLVQVRPQAESKGLASPFNVKKESLTLPNFTQEEIKALYHQHTEASGQIFEPEAIVRAWYWSEGQPWLVNALAYEVVTKILNKRYSETITGALIDQGAQALILRRDTHLDSLTERLKEPRVSRIFDVIQSSRDRYPKEVSDDDKRYVLDLGLIKTVDGIYQPANPIYEEVISRAASHKHQDNLPADLTFKWLDGHKLYMTSLLKDFQRYWRINADMIDDPHNFNESIPHILIFAYMQKVVNGGATISREYAFGRMRVDVNVTYKGVSYPVEIKIRGLDKFVESRTRDSLKQLRSYMDKCGAKEGWLVVFDRGKERSWDEKITWETTQFEGVTIHIVGC